MDIEYLLLLQRFRESTHDLLTPILVQISRFSVTYLILLPVFVYWALDKKKGLYTLVAYYLCCSVNAIVKLMACVYRPWIRDARVLPAGDSLLTATGYSFPSGHTATAGPIYGGLAIAARRRWKLLSVLFLIALLLTGFARNYLGVHTPQDVIIAMLESALALFAAAKLFAYLEKHPEKENLFLLGGFLFGWLAIVYITFKPYPMDYMDGKLLVDPQKMMNDGYGDIALLIAFPVARYIEKTWIRFKATGLRGLGLLTAAVGLVPMFFIIRDLGAPLDTLLGTHWGHFAKNAILVFYSIALWPLVIRTVDRLRTGAKDRR